MLKQRLIRIIAGLALLLTLAGLSGIATDSLGLISPPAAFACQSSSSSGGGC